MNIILTIILISLFWGCSQVGADEESFDIFTEVGNRNFISSSAVEVSAAKNQSVNLKDDWYKDSSFYHIWVKSFNDSNGDGCGDLKGIEEKLDYVKNLGFDSILLSPIFDCNYKSTLPNDNMNGYDVINFYSINPLFGTMEDLENLINSAHSKGLKIIFDFNPNSTSSAHPWFLSSKDGKNKRDWYLWSDEKLNWNNGLSQNNWYKDGSSYYYGALGGSLPDLNFRNYEVREEMKNVVRYWLNIGFDGLRIEGVEYLIEEENKFTNTQSSHLWYQELKEDVLSQYESPKLMVCEARIENDRNTLDSYFGTIEKPEFDLVLDFDAGCPSVNSVISGTDITGYTLEVRHPQGFYGTFVGNHNEYLGRIGSVLGNQDAKIKLATALSLIRPTVPFVYYGNELGQLEENVPGSLRLRGPFSWDYAEFQNKDEKSLLKLNTAILNLRNRFSDLRTGVLTKLSSDKDDKSILGYIIEGSSAKFLAVYNLSNKSRDMLLFNLGQYNINPNANYSILIGDKDQDKTLSITEDSIVVSNMAPYSYRLYLLGTDRVKNVFDDEVYVENEVYVDCPRFVYIRGSFNEWKANSVMGLKVETDSENNSIVTYTYDIKGSSVPESSKFEGQRLLEFKFDESGKQSSETTWALSKENKLTSDSGKLSNGSEADKNIKYLVDETKTYTITFNYTDKTYSIEEKK